ncbi:thioredoxin family protein [Pontibacterium granulatum]|uniref:thioredoxin family protein n=1 Tax=Pontibacterium granulatum TaxID=2036029 RepID=UPI00249C2A01|nr:thioredoxin family protein [Pontibacterium granulatum]MDI3323420.1 thioredoxin family protein [Pontibacterium granulatum]
MRVQLLVTRTDFSVPNLEQEFKDLGIHYEIAYLENHPEMVKTYNIRHSPNIVVDGKLAFRHQPSEQELRQYFDGLKH